MLPWLLCFFLASVAAQCPPQSPSVSCSTATLFVLDATNYLTQTDIQNEFNFTMSYLLPKLNLPIQEATFVSYGSKTAFTPLSTAYPLVCSQLSNLYFDAVNKGGQRATLTSTMNQIYSDYQNFIGPGFTIQLFSASTDQNDINAAGAFVQNNMRGVQFTVISLSYNGGIWNGFPYTTLYTFYPWTLSPLLGNCLMNNACGNNSYCELNPTTSTASTSTSTTTTTTRAPTTTTTTLPPPPSGGPQCQYNYSTSWNDVIFLVDASAYVGNFGLQELLGYIQTSMAYFNVQRAYGNNTTPYHTRIGIILYSTQAQVYSRLGLMNGDDLQSINSLPYLGGYGTNLNMAFEFAINELFGAYSRPNARPVIVIVGSTYSNQSNYLPPQSSADEFRKMGGIVITYDYAPGLQQPDPVLQAAANPGYVIVSWNDNGHRLQDALCDANCKCPVGTSVYSTDITGKPTSGCFTPVETLGNLQVANNKCKLLGGYVAEGKTSGLTWFIYNLFSSPSSFLAGMQWDSFSNYYRWVDGSLVSGSYQPWFNNATHQSGRDCVYVYNNAGQLQWVPSDCRNGFFYACQGAPCDSTNYC